MVNHGSKKSYILIINTLLFIRIHLFNFHVGRSTINMLSSESTQEKLTDGRTSVSFTSLRAGHEYLVEVYIPASNFFTGIEVYQVEGNKVSRDLDQLFNQSKWYSGRWYSGANRYVTLGNRLVSNDGVLDVKWSHANAAQQIFIRELPTPEQAYSWISPDS